MATRFCIIDKAADPKLRELSGVVLATQNSELSSESRYVLDLSIQQRSSQVESSHEYEQGIPR